METIDFDEEKYLEPFQGVPAFVFHGERDLNVPFAGTEEFMTTLESAGAHVEFHTEEETGHENPGDETMAAYKRWVERVFGE